MAIEEMREVSIPLGGEDTGSTPDTGTDDGANDDGGGSDADAAPAQQQRQPARQADGKFTNKPARADRRADFQANRRFTEEITGLKTTIQQQQQRYDRDMAELRRIALEGRQSAAPAAPVASASDQKIATLKQALAAEVSAARNHDPNKGQYDLTRYEKLREDLEEARIEAKIPQILKARGIDLDRRPDPNQRPMGQREAAQTAADVMRRETMVAEAPWLAEAMANANTDPRQKQILDAFKAEIEYLETRKGRRPGINTDREAAAIVERDFRLAPRRGAAPPPRMPIGDQYRGGGDEDGPRVLEVPSAQLDGVSPDIQRRVAARMRGR